LVGEGGGGGTAARAATLENENVPKGCEVIEPFFFGEAVAFLGSYIFRAVSRKRMMHWW
jgi:hypothetical protein